MHLQLEKQLKPERMLSKDEAARSVKSISKRTNAKHIRSQKEFRSSNTPNS